MIAERKTIEKYLADFKKKADTAYMNYQDSGMPAYERTYRKYQDLSEYLEIALQTSDDKDSERERRARNIIAMADQLEDKAYTKKEVKEMLLKVAYL